MNILIFFCGAGVGALITAILSILTIGAAAREPHKQPEWAKRQHDELIALWAERNALYRQQNQILSEPSTEAAAYKATL